MPLTIVDKNINQIKPYQNNQKLHSKHQIKQIVDSNFRNDLHAAK